MWNLEDSGSFPIQMSRANWIFKFSHLSSNRDGFEIECANEQAREQKSTRMNDTSGDSHTRQQYSTTSAEKY